MIGWFFICSNASLIHVWYCYLNLLILFIWLILLILLILLIISYHIKKLTNNTNKKSKPPHLPPHNLLILLITSNPLLLNPKFIYQHPQLLRYPLITVELLFYLLFIILKPDLFVLDSLFFQVLINSPTLFDV